MAKNKNKYLNIEDLDIQFKEYLNKAIEPNIENYVSADNDVYNLKEHLMFESDHKKWKDYMQSKIMNKKLKHKLIKIIKKELNIECRVEALSLFKLATREEIGNFLYYVYYAPNVAPCVIDSIKDRLCEEGTLKYKKGDSFGLTSNTEFDED